MTDRLIRILASVYALILAAVLLNHNRRFYHDDAYITLRYARNWLAGNGLVWNPGEYVQGYTSFLHLALVAALGRLGLDLVVASRMVGVTAFCGLVAVVALLPRAVARNQRAAFAWHIPLILVATSAPLIVWSVGGLEGTCFALLVTGGCLLLLLAADSPGRVWLSAASGFCMGLCYLTRPDGIVFFLVSLVWLLHLALKDRARGLTAIIAFMAGAMCVVLPYAAWQLFYYGNLVPNTFFAKAGSPLWLRLGSGWQYVVEYMARPPFVPAFAAAALVYAAVRRRWSRALTYLTLSICAYMGSIILMGGDHMQSFRLFVPMIPLLSVVPAVALHGIETKGRMLERVLTLAVLVAVSLQVQDTRLNARREDSASNIGTAVGRYIEGAWLPGSLVALNTAGSTPYHAPSHRYIDMLGLNDATIARRTIDKVELPWQRVPGHLKGDGAYVLSRRPDYIILGPAMGTDVSEPWFLSDHELSRDPRFLRDYARQRVLLELQGRRRLLFTYYQRQSGR